MENHAKNETVKIIEMGERPRERCLKSGAHTLSLRECIAILLGSGPKNKGCLGVANEILEKPGEGLSSEEKETAFFTAMEVSAQAHLNEIGGLGEAGIAKLLSTFEIARRYADFREKRIKMVSDTPTSQHSSLVLEKIPLELRSSPQEWLGFVPLYKNFKLGEFCLVEKGARTHVNTDPVELFARLLSLRPAGFFLFHNHPSGCLEASDEDITLTRTIDDLSSRLGVCLFGHAIISFSNSLWVKW